MYKHNWIQLKAEYLASDFLTIAEFFRKKHPEVSIGVYQKTAKGWVTAKHELHEKVLAKMVNKKASTVARHARLGRKIQVLAGRKLTKNSFAEVEGKDIVAAIKTGVEIENRAYGVEGPSVATQFNVQVNNGPTISDEALSALGEFIARAKAKGNGQGDASLGIGEDREG